jgi:hypothetical protein
MNPPKSPTPRTDAECIQIYQEDVTGCSNAIDYVPASVARTLETELTKTERLRFGADADRRRLRAEVERLKEWLADPHNLHAHCLRTLTEGQIAHLFGERMTEIVNRAEKAEAELADWSVLKAWGGTPEIIHQFVKGQQNRIHHCQDLEAILNEETNRAEKVEADNAKWQKLLLMSRDDREIDLISEVEEQARFLSMAGEREANLLSALKLMVTKFDAYIDSEYCGTELLAEQLAQADFAREVIRVSDLRKKEMQIPTDQ